MDNVRHYCRLAVILVSCVLFGCPLQSKFPLGDSNNAPMDERLLGVWIIEEPEELKNGKLSIFSFNETEYYMESQEPKSGETGRSRAFITIIDNVIFLNFQEIEHGSSERDYGFLKISVSSSNVLRIWSLEDGLLPRKPTSTEDLSSFVRDNINNPKLYGKERITLKKQTNQ